MNLGWLYSKHIIPSEKNGAITVRRLFGNTSIFVGGFDQSSPYISKLQKKALRKLPSTASIKHILVLGLGGGSVIPHLHKQFKKAQVTVVEWDPVMIDLARKSGIFSKSQTPEIILGDAVEVVTQLSKQFDLIVVDLFKGKETEPRLYAQEMLEHLKRLLKRQGFLILNPFRNVKLIDHFKAKLSCHLVWKYRFNTLALFRHFGQGKAGDPLPAGYLHHTQSTGYLLGSWPKNENAQLVGQVPAQGVSWNFSFLRFESYITDQEPTLDRQAPSRLVMWQPLTLTAKPAGWRKSWLQMNSRQHGFTDLAGQDQYWLAWSAHAQRSRNKWLAQTSYKISHILPEEFITAFHATKKLPRVRSELIRFLQNRLRRQPEDIKLFGAVEKQTGKVIAGLAVCNIPDVSQSIHLISFTHPSFENTQVGTGLIDHWFAECIRHGLRFAHFGLVWTKGDPRGWQGYSKFKMQFNIFLLRYPPTFFRIVRKA